MTEPDLVHTCSRVGDIPDPPIEQSAKDVCAKCGHEVWYRLVDREHLLETHPGEAVEVWCVQCTPISYKEMEEVFMYAMLGLDLPEGFEMNPSVPDAARKWMEENE